MCRSGPESIGRQLPPMAEAGRVAVGGLAERYPNAAITRVVRDQPARQPRPTPEEVQLVGRRRPQAAPECWQGR